MVCFSDTLPRQSPLLIIMNHLELTPVSYKLNLMEIRNYFLFVDIVEVYHDEM